MQRALGGLAQQQQQQQQQQPGSLSDGGTGEPSSGGGAGGGGLPGIAALERQLYTAGCPPVDLLIRTSGETRLSDFLLWQSRHALLVFTGVLWPDFGFLDLAAAVLRYQRAHPHLRRLRAAADAQAAAATAGGQQLADADDIAAAAARGAATAQPDLQLPLGKLAGGPRRRRGSPCSVASPASPSSPSSRSGSEGSEEGRTAAAAAAAAAAIAAAAAGQGGAAAGLRQRLVAGGQDAS